MDGERNPKGLQSNPILTDCIVRERPDRKSPIEEDHILGTESLPTISSNGHRGHFVSIVAVGVSTKPPLKYFRTGDEDRRDRVVSGKGKRRYKNKRRLTIFELSSGGLTGNSCHDFERTGFKNQYCEG